VSYAAYLKPRPEVISEDGVEGIVDLANLKDQSMRKLESRPKDFLDLTFPTTDLARVLEQINLRFSSTKDVSGLFLFEGLKGSGKSHLLLTVYNLFGHKEIAQEWLKKNGLVCKIPDDSVVIINKFTDDPYDSIWGMIFEVLGRRPPKGKTHPKKDDFQKALGDRKIILIFDELEQGIKVISDPALRAQNVAFLQMLSEFSNRSRQVTLFASTYSDKEEPGSTLKRVPRCVVQFDNVGDQNNVILHRLFDNYRTFDKSIISPVIESYVQLWDKHAPHDKDEHKNRFLGTYPFSPSLMDIILKKIPARGGFQNVRGALAFLGNMVRLTHSTNDIITPADASLQDRATTIMLKDLDPSGDLIIRACENMEDLVPKTPLAVKLASTVLLYTLTGRGGDNGASREKLLMDILSPSIDINAFEQTLMGFTRYASYFHHQENRYYFDLEENSEAKVEFKSIQYSDDQAREKLNEILKDEIFKESNNTTIFTSIQQVQESLKQFEKNRPRYVLTGRRLTQEERHLIYHGMDFRNLILLLEPKDDAFQLSTNRDLLKWAKRILAAKDLKPGSKPARQADYDRIARIDQANITERIKKAGLVFVSWQKYGASVPEDRVELEPLPSDFSKDKVLEKLNQDYFPSLRFKEHMEARLTEIKGRLVKEIDMEYRSALGFPVPVTVTVVSKAVSDLCKDGLIGIQHSSGNFCHIRPNLSENELSSARITDPFDTPPRKEVCPNCGKLPCVCQALPVTCSVCGQSPCVCAPVPEPLCPNCGKRPCICLKKDIFSLAIPPQISIGGLRQQAALRLQEHEGAAITRVSYKIFFQKDSIGDLSTLPAGLRGSLSGQGDLTAEITISKSGKFPKSQIESQIECLPAFPGAEYSADLEIEVTR